MNIVNIDCIYANRYSWPTIKSKYKNSLGPCLIVYFLKIMFNCLLDLNMLVFFLSLQRTGIFASNNKEVKFLTFFCLSIFLVCIL
jgi:hypothetical protein